MGIHLSDHRHISLKNIVSLYHFLGTIMTGNIELLHTVL